MVVRTTRNVTSGLTRIKYAQERDIVRDVGRETAATGAALEVLIVAASQGNPFRRRFRARGVNGRENAVASKHQHDGRRESFELLRRGGVLGLDVVAGSLSPALVERYLE